MRNQVLASIAALTLAIVPAAGQATKTAPKANTAPAAKATWTAPRTADGQIDLQGVWTNNTIAKEYYLSITFDRGAKQPLYMLTKEGGIEIEQVAEENPDALSRLHVDPLEGFQAYQARRRSMCITITRNSVWTGSSPRWRGTGERR